MITKPMKAATWEEGVTISFPVLGTYKFDGIRCLKVGGRALSSQFKPIPNDFIRTWIEANCPDGYDGEIMIPGRQFSDLSGDVRRKDGKPDFEYHVFDLVWDNLDKPYTDRVIDLISHRSVLKSHEETRVRGEIPVEIKTLEELQAFEEQALSSGHEGIMIRSPGSPYKCGRSTVKEGYLLKIKRFKDDEAEVIRAEEEMENTNVAERDAFGRTKRSHHASGMVPKGRLGKLVCRTKAGVEFEIGTGFNAAQRIAYWAERASLPGRLAKFKHQPHGAKEKPRCPVFLGFRDTWDL